jgi:Spy/CpxP family protein refolding chaperone
MEVPMRIGVRSALAACSAVTFTAWLAPLPVLAQPAADQAPPARPVHARKLMAQGAQELRLAIHKLDLTEAQRAQVQEILQRHREGTRAAVQKTMAARRTVGDAATATPVDEAAIRAAAQAFGESEAELALLRARVRAEVWDVLTPDQRAKAEQMRTEYRERVQRRAQGRAARPARGAAAGEAPAAPVKPPVR